MKAIISKSVVMKRAWSIFRSDNPFSYSFSASLERAWRVEKESAKQAAEKAAQAIEAAKWTVKNQVKFEFNPATMVEYYQGAGSKNRYFGD